MYCQVFMERKGRMYNFIIRNIIGKIRLIIEEYANSIVWMQIYLLKQKKKIRAKLEKQLNECSVV